MNQGLEGGSNHLYEQLGIKGNSNYLLTRAKLWSSQSIVCKHSTRAMELKHLEEVHWVFFLVLCFLFCKILLFFKKLLKHAKCVCIVHSLVFHVDSFKYIMYLYHICYYCISLIPLLPVSCPLVSLPPSHPPQYYIYTANAISNSTPV